MIKEDTGCGGLPPGAECDYNAPFDYSEVESKEFNVICSQTLSKPFKVMSDSYTPKAETVYEEGHRYVDEWDDTSGIDWKEEFYNNDCHDALALIKLFKNFLEKQLHNGIVFKSPAYTKALIEECKGWEEDNLDIYEN